MISNKTKSKVNIDKLFSCIKTVQRNSEEQHVMLESLKSIFVLFCSHNIDVIIYP